MKNILTFKLKFKITLIVYIFLISFGICSGVYLNKVYGMDYAFLKAYASEVMNYYEFQNMNFWNILFLNLKNDAFYMFFIYFLSIAVVTCPLIIIVIFLKGLSIGYSINLSILSLKYESIKIIVLTLMKNVIIIPASAILIVLILNYSVEIINNINKNRKYKSHKKLKKIFIKHTTNTICIVCVILLVQTIVNVVSVYIIKVLS